MLWEAVGVSRDGLVERSGLHAVQLREVAVEHDLFAADGVDHAFDSDVAHGEGGSSLLREVDGRTIAGIFAVLVYGRCPPRRR